MYCYVNGYANLKTEPMIVYNILRWDNFFHDWFCTFWESVLLVMCLFTWSFFLTFPALLSCHVAESLKTVCEGIDDEGDLEKNMKVLRKYRVLTLAFEQLTGEMWTSFLLGFYAIAGFQQFSVAYCMFQQLSGMSVYLDYIVAAAMWP